jgi:integrase
VSASSYVESVLKPGLKERRYSTGRVVHRGLIYHLGQQHSATFEDMTRTEAKEAFVAFAAEVKGESGGKLDEAAPRTLAELLDRAFAILDDEADAGLGSRDTVTNYKAAARLRIKPHPIARKKPRELDDDICTTWLVWLRKQPGTSFTHHGTVTAFQTALRIGRLKKWLKHDPFAAVDRKYFPPQEATKPTVALDNDQTLALIAAAHSEKFRSLSDTDYSNLITVNRYELHRSSETCGLRWKDVDWKENKLAVNGQLQRRQRANAPVGFDGPKNKKDGVRNPIMFPQTRAALLRQREVEFAKGKGRPEDLVFTKADGKPITETNLRDAVKRAARIAGLGYVTPRQLRTSGLTAGAMAGIPSVQLSTRSGNSPATIEAVYIKKLHTAAVQQANIDSFLQAGFGG